MKILLHRNINYNPSFKSATVNINALSDTHGELAYANCGLEEMRSRKDDIFCKEGKGNANILAITGDWFIDGSKKGYYSSPNKEKAKFQLEILNGFISQIKEMAKNTTTLFTPGNHEFDGGVKLLDSILENLDAEVLMTNLHLPTSNGLTRSISGEKIINQKIVEIEDDKNDKLKHKILFLGVSPVNLQYYQSDCSGVDLFDNVLKPQRNVKENDYQVTLLECKQRIEKFKKENPNGVVILLSHTGVEFADNLAKRTTVDLVFDGHEHKDSIRYVNKTPIIGMSQNFEKIVNTTIKFDDSGKCSFLDITSFNPKQNKNKGFLFDLYSRIFREDTKNQYSLKTKFANVKKLSLDGVRTGNSFLANFITDSVLKEIRKEQPDVDFFALNSSAIRHSLSVSKKPEISHFDILNVLSGIREEDGKVMITEVSGLQLLEMIVDNLLFNSIMPKKNPIIQYSGLFINKTTILDAYEMGCLPDELSSLVIDMNTGKKIDLNKKYKIANVEKYFDKTENSKIARMKSKSTYLGHTVHELFERHFENSQDNLVADCDIRYI